MPGTMTRRRPPTSSGRSCPGPGQQPVNEEDEDQRQCAVRSCTLALVYYGDIGFDCNCGTPQDDGQGYCAYCGDCADIRANTEECSGCGDLLGDDEKADGIREDCAV